MRDQGLLERAVATAQVFVNDLNSLELTKTDIHHLFAVRRVRDGEIIVASDGLGSWRMTTANGQALEATGPICFEPEPDPPLTVAFAPVKGDRNDWAVAKLTELGCDRIVALETDRSVVRWGSDAGERSLSRWSRLAHEACCQSRRVRIPTIDGPVSLATFIGSNAILGVPGAAVLSAGSHTVLVGPEGGWSEAELALGFTEATLGTQILRTETAAVAAGVLLGALRAGTVASMEKRDPS